MESIFNNDFYPTPRNIIELMLQEVDIRDKNFLEPSAGKGDIAKYLNENGANQVCAFEKNADLRKILSQHATILGDDFLQCTAEQVSHVQYIVMNPPFSADEKHIIHAWNIAPEGSEIIALCNSETIRKTYYSRDREILSRIVDDYGNYDNLGNAFANAERKTNVEVSLIRLYKPMLSAGMDFEGFYLDEQEIHEEDSIIKHSELRNFVESYIKAVRCFDELKAVNEKMKTYTEISNFGHYGSGCVFSVSHNENIVTKEDFARQMQKHCWNKVFNMMKVDRYVTSGVMKDINRFVETQTKVPFTVRNIYRMVEILVGTSKQTMNRAVVEAIDNFTKHTHENRYAVEGWKTNTGHLLNKKFIIPYIVKWSDWHGKLDAEWGSYREHLSDLQKVLCYVTGRDYNKETDFDAFCGKMQMQTNTWYSWSFFEIKGFKKGTLHLKFQNIRDWELLNRAYAQAKGSTLPEKI